MRAIETEGASIDEAVAAGLAALGGVPRDAVDVEVMAEPSRGLLGFGSQPARVRVTVRDGDASGDVSRETSDGGIGAARTVLDEILRHLTDGARVEMRTDGEPGTTAFIVHEAEGGVLIGRHGATVDAIEHLLNRVVPPGRRIALDVAGYRERRRETLEGMARRLAEKARMTGRRVEMDPMSPRDRRTIHLALRDEAGVTTRSEGDGHYRHVVIEPTAGPRR